MIHNRSAKFSVQGVYESPSRFFNARIRHYPTSAHKTPK